MGVLTRKYGTYGCQTAGLRNASAPFEKTKEMSFVFQPMEIVFLILNITNYNPHSYNIKFTCIIL
jgi:hypothetical protein